MKQRLISLYADDSDETISELLKKKYQVLVSVDEHANIYTSEEVRNLENHCSANDIEFLKSVTGDRILVEGCGKAQHYGDVFPQAYGIVHILSDIELSAKPCDKVMQILLSLSPDLSILCLMRSKQDGKYHCAVLSSSLIRAMNLVSVDNDIYPLHERKFLGFRTYKESQVAPREYNYPFHDFLVGIAYRIKKAGSRFEEVVF